MNMFDAYELVYEHVSSSSYGVERQGPVVSYLVFEEGSKQTRFNILLGDTRIPHRHTRPSSHAAAGPNPRCMMTFPHACVYSVLLYIYSKNYNTEDFRKTERLDLVPLLHLPLAQPLALRRQHWRVAIL